MDASLDSFMTSPLVVWIQTFSVEPLTYSDLCDGAYLNDVMQQIYGTSHSALSVEPGSPETDENASYRLKSWIALLNAVNEFYRDVLREYIVAPLPDVLKICLQPECAVNDIEMTLLLVLGCAVHCDRKEIFVERIKTLNIDIQEHIVESIKKRSNCQYLVRLLQKLKKCGQNVEFHCGTPKIEEEDDKLITIVPRVLGVESCELVVESTLVEGVVGETFQVTDTAQTVLSMDISLDDDISKMLFEHINQLLKQRNNELVRFANVASKASSVFRRLNSKRVSVRTATSSDPSGHRYTSEGRPNSTTHDPTSVIRALREQLDERSIEVEDLTEELDDLRLVLQKLKTEKFELTQEANNARVFRDELDCLRDKANRAGKLESEVAKLRERSNELEFVKLRIEELRTENHLLLETKQELEYQLSTKDELLSRVVELEKELHRNKQLLEVTSSELDLGRRRMQALTEENAQLEMARSDSMSHMVRFEEQLMTSVRQTNDGISVSSLSDQMSDSSTKKLLKVELENKRLLRQMNSIASKLQSLNGISNKHSNGNNLGHKLDNDKNDEVVDIHIINDEKSISSRPQHDVTAHRKSTTHVVVNDESLISNVNGTVSTQPTETSVEDSVEELLADNRRLHSIVAGLRSACESHASAERRSDDLEAENVRLRRRLESAERVVIRCNELEQAVARLTLDVETQRRAADRAAELSATVAESEIEIESLRRTTVDLRATLDSARTDADRELGDLSADRDRLRRRADAAVARITDLQRRSDEFVVENGRLRRSADVTAESIRWMERRVAELEGDIEAAGVEKASLMEGITKLEEQCQLKVETANMRCRTAEQRVEELERRLGDASCEKTVQQELLDKRLRPSDEQPLIEKKNDKDERNPEMDDFLPDTTTICCDSIFPCGDHFQTKNMKDRLISLERQNAAMEEERRILRQRCAETETSLRVAESSNLQLTADLSTARGQISAVEPRLERLESEHAAVTQRCADLGALNSTLLADSDRLRAKVARATDELHRAATDRADLTKRVEQVSAEFELQRRGRSNAEEELELLVDRVRKVAAERDELLQWKSDVEQRRWVSEETATVVDDDKMLVNEMAAAVLENNVRLEAERDRNRDEVERLSGQLKDTSSERDRWRSRCETLSDEISDSRRKIAFAELQCCKLENKCDSLAEMNVRHEEERQLLMKQLQSIMDQAQELLTELISSKDHYASDQKNYLLQLFELRQQKEKLEEKIMEQQKMNSSSKKKNKGFGAVLVRKARNVMTRGRSKNDLRPKSATELRFADEDDMTSTFNDTFSPSINDVSSRIDLRPKSPSHRSTSSDEPAARFWSGNSHRPTITAARSSSELYPPSKTVSWNATGEIGTRHRSVLFEDETITLDQFLQECNRSPPKSKKQPLVITKTNGTATMPTCAREKTGRQSNWTSLLSLFHSTPSVTATPHMEQQQPSLISTSPRSDPRGTPFTKTDANLSRAFRSEVNVSTSSSPTPNDRIVKTGGKGKRLPQRPERRSQIITDCGAIDRLDHLVSVEVQPTAPARSHGKHSVDTGSEDAAVDRHPALPEVPSSVNGILSYTLSTRSSESSRSSVACRSSRSASSQSATSASQTFARRNADDTSRGSQTLTSGNFSSRNQSAMIADKRVNGSTDGRRAFSAGSSVPGSSSKLFSLNRFLTSNKQLWRSSSMRNEEHTAAGIIDDCFEESRVCI